MRLKGRNNLWKSALFLVKLDMYNDLENENLMASVTFPEAEINDELITGTGLSTRVILFNDEVHTFEEVIGQILKAIRCSLSKAQSLTWEVHSKGKATIYEGELLECIRISTVLEEIRLHTQIEV